MTASRNLILTQSSPQIGHHEYTIHDFTNSGKYFESSPSVVKHPQILKSHNTLVDKLSMSMLWNSFK